MSHTDPHGQPDLTRERCVIAVQNGDTDVCGAHTIGERAVYTDGLTGCRK